MNQCNTVRDTARPRLVLKVKPFPSGRAIWRVTSRVNGEYWIGVACDARAAYVKAKLKINGRTLRFSEVDCFPE